MHDRVTHVAEPGSSQSVRRAVDKSKGEKTGLPPQGGLAARLDMHAADGGSANAPGSQLNRVVANDPSNAARAILQLQRRLGNQHVQRMLKVSRQSEGGEVDSGVAETIQRARGGGQALDHGVQMQMESAFGADFTGVRVHADAQADTLNHAVNARAFTVGQDIFFRSGEYTPGSSTGRELLAHELTHVVQQTGSVLPEPAIREAGNEYERDTNEIARNMAQRDQQARNDTHLKNDVKDQNVLSVQWYPLQHRSIINLQRQEIPRELYQSVNLKILSKGQLHQRYDLISSTLSKFQSSSVETILLENEAGNIGIELNRRKALEAGRTFYVDAINQMRQYFTDNAKSAKPDSCIVTLNKGMRLLLNDPTQKVGGEIEKTMGKLQAAGHSGEAKIIGFEDKKGRVTTGTLFPQRLHESVWDALITMANGEPGWSVFGLSLMDGTHSVTLTLDNNDPSKPQLYWSDQWSSKGGWKEHNRADLDAEIIRLTQGWWNNYPWETEADALKHPPPWKPNTRLRLWRIKGTPSLPANSNP